MHADIAVIVPYFNFLRYQSLRRNAINFRKRLTYPAIFVEASLTGLFDVATEPTDIQLHATTRNILFQRNRLVNLAIRRLPDSVTKIAWVDADILFEDDRWLDKLSELLDSVDVAQPFTSAISLDATAQPTRTRPSWCSIMGTSADIWTSSRGYAWGARLDRLPYIPGDVDYRGLLDRQMLAEDTIMAMYWSGYGLGGDIRQISHQMTVFCETWAGADQKRKTGFLPGSVAHVYHGDYLQQHVLDRQYLQDIGYNPFQDLVIDENGLYAWSDKRDRPIVYFLESMRQRGCDRHLSGV